MTVGRMGSDSFLEKPSGTLGDAGLKHLVLLHSDFTEQREDLFIPLGYIGHSTNVYIKQKGTMFKKRGVNSAGVYLQQTLDVLDLGGDLGTVAVD